MRKHPIRKIDKNKKGIEKVRAVLRKQKYSLVGNHSGVQVCRWTRNSLNKEGGCWKEKFYGIKSHRCCQMSPAVMWCENQCLHCWRPIEMSLGDKLKEVDDPKEILKGIIKAREKLLMGFKGSKKVSKKKFLESLVPSLFTFSLSGEATIYPHLEEMIKEIRKMGAVSFLVTHGLNPDAIKKLEREKALPTQLTVSVNASNETLFKRWTRTRKKNAWVHFLKTLDLIKGLKGKCRRVLRLTLVKGENMDDLEGYVALIKKAEPDFVHVKGFMSVGWARERLGYDKQPRHYEVRRFAEKLVRELRGGWKILEEEKRSCVVVLGKSRRGMRINLGRV